MNPEGPMAKASGSTVVESQRDSGSKPWVARNELPWVSVRRSINPNGVVALLGYKVTTPLGLSDFAVLSQGSSFLATLGWRAQSLWDCRTLVFVALLGFEFGACGQGLSLPERATGSPTAHEIVQRITSLDFTNREQEIISQVLAGNVPDFYRKFCPVAVTNVGGGKTNWAIFYAAPDYLAVGSDEDYFLAPLTPVTAQRLADSLGCTLPTRKIVDDIYAAATVKLVPTPMTPGPRMTTVPMFAEHNSVVRTQRMLRTLVRPLGELVAGHKKDVVITTRLTNAPGKVAIYGWHKTNGAPIQPLYLGHTANWVDYSHGIRLVQQQLTVNGATKTVAEVLADPELCGLLIDEGVITTPQYETNTTEGTNGTDALSGFRPTGSFGEMTNSFVFDPEVKIHINAPLHENFSTNKPVMLIIYALPNGNTTEQTIGRKLKPADDWHFDIQHIGAQTRWLRERLKDRTIVVAYLEAAMKSWPAWRRKHGDAKIAEMMATVKNHFVGHRIETVLTGHSGGGSLTFGYLNSVTNIPDDVTRIAFLDSNYAYSTTNHLAKLGTWLKVSPEHRLCVLAYHDDIALLEGKTFVSAEGGTWGRSHAMLKDLRASFDFTSTTRGNLETATALAGRIQFLLMENPERKILHTVQVDRNGFIQAMLSGTAEEGKGYEYFGERAFTKLIEGD